MTDIGAEDVKILGFGNPLLDIIAEVDDVHMEKFKLRVGGYCFWNKEDHADLHEHLKSRPDVKYVPGGSTQNAVRVAQGLLKTPGKCAFVGCVADDEWCKTMKRINKEGGVVSLYETAKDSTVQTGVCGVCLNHGDRSMCTFLGAAEHYPEEVLMSARVKSLISQSEIVLSECYWLTVVPKGLAHVGSLCNKHHKTFAINLSAAPIVTSFFDGVSELVKLSDIVTGNTEEWAAYYDKLHQEGGKTFFPKEGAQCLSEDEVAAKLGDFLSTLCTKTYRKNSTLTKILIGTRSSNSTIVVFKGMDMDEPCVEEYPVPSIPAKLIVDVNTAGDAFLGGFLAATLEDQSIEKCVELGHLASREVICNNGCSFDFSYLHLTPTAMN